jgi:capsular polysaccharide export protein
MDQYEACAPSEMSVLDAAPSHAALKSRSFLFLQGPISSFFDRLGRALIARGHRVHRINLHFGDQLFWRLPATHFRGRFEDWRGFVAGMLEEHRVTDLVLHGDRRPYHIVAAEEARSRGIAVIVTDLGYVRPDWLTLEYDGMTTYSRFPRDPAAIRALAAEFPEPELGPRFHTPFWLIAVLDVAYNLGMVFGRLLYPHYRYHSIVHPFAEYAGWVWSRAKRLFTAKAAAVEKRRLAADPGSYFLVPLQLSTDFQIRAHSPFRNVCEAVREIVASFAASGSGKKLIFVVHPLDNGLIGWSRLIARLARHYGIAEQVRALPGGTPSDLLRNAAGVVTINSTVGVAALQHGVPVKVLGNAVFDVAGLTCQAPLAAFWHNQPPLDGALMTDFLRALIGTTQVKGGYYERASQACAITGFVERLESGIYPLLPLTPTDLTARAPGTPARTVVVAGVSEGLGVALARTHAMPGVRLFLMGTSGGLARTAEDCRRRGAGVSMLTDEWRGVRELTSSHAECPIDLLAVMAGPDIGRVIAVVDPLVELLRRQGGAIVLVGPRTEELLRYSRSLRQQLRPHGVSVLVAMPGFFAARLATRLRYPEIAAIGAERAARLICQGIARRHKAILFPGAATLGVRTVRLVPKMVRNWAAVVSIPSGEPVVDEPREVRLSDTGTGD